VRFRVAVAAVGLLATLPASSGAQLLYDDFDVFHDYATGTVPAGGFWTGVHNVLNVCQDFPPVIQAHGADAFGVPKPGVLFMEDTNCFMGPGGPGVGWEASRTTAPMLYREIPAAYDFYAEMKINAQTAGQWSSAGIVARRKGPPVGVAPSDPNENFFAAMSFRAQAGDPNQGQMRTIRVQNGVGVESVNPWGGGSAADPEPLPVYVRLVKNGQSLTSMSSLDGLSWFDERTFTAPFLTAPKGVIQVGPTFHMLGGGMGAAEIDYFRLQTVYEVFPASWRVNGGGDWRSPANWLFGSFPDTIGISVSLGEFATSDATIFIDADVTIGSLTFENDHKYAVAGAGLLFFDRDPFIEPWPARIEVQRGAHELQVSMALNAPLEIDASSGTRLDLNNRLTLNGHPLTVTGAGIVSFNNEVVADGGSVINNGVLAGSATIFGSLVNAAGATLKPGNSPGALHVSGSYTQDPAAALEIELGGVVSGRFDVLSVSETLSAGGMLAVTLIDGFEPRAGDVFDILDFAEQRGAFDLDLPTLGAGLRWDASALSSRGELSVQAAAPEPAAMTLLAAAWGAMIGARRTGPRLRATRAPLGELSAASRSKRR
jgi:hypothetical protein